MSQEQPAMLNVAGREHDLENDKARMSNHEIMAKRGGRKRKASAVACLIQNCSFGSPRLFFMQLASHGSPPHQMFHRHSHCAFNTSINASCGILIFPML